jgi:3-methyl-2-oxobutanoate hydroxymethyltransferase
MGYESTIPVTMTDMLHHAKCVHRGNQTSFLVGDMPFGSYEPSSALAVENAMRLIKEANMNAIKLEGGKRMAARAKAIVEAGIPVQSPPPPPWELPTTQRSLTTGGRGDGRQVMGHIGLTPQSIHSLGGFKVQGALASTPSYE